MSEAPETTCPRCNLPYAPEERSGSLTSFLFADLHCQCHLDSTSLAKNRAPADSESCRRCGKVIHTQKHAGSFTSFLLRDMRCSCATPLRPQSSKSMMTTRYKPRDKNSTRRREAAQTAVRQRAAANFARDAAMVSLQPGEIIGGCYRLDALVGKGGMGVVYRASHVTLARVVALKFLAPSLVSIESWQQFQKEAKINSSLSHPLLCQIYDLGIHSGSLPFYAMDYVDGKTLEQIILQNGPLSVGAMLEVFIKVAEGLSYAHRRSIVHKDIKPANIMVSRKTDGTVEIKLLDFGISELGDRTDRRKKREQDAVLGSAAYMSPEQFDGHEIDLRSDIYSLGCSMFETLTGSLPFEGETFEDYERGHKQGEPPLLSDITNMAYPDTLEAVLKKCLQKRRDYRYQNANELAIDLKRVRDDKELQFAGAELDLLKAQRITPGGGAISAKTMALALFGTGLIAAGAMLAVLNLNKPAQGDILNKKVNYDSLMPVTKQTHISDPRSTFGTESKERDNVSNQLESAIGGHEPSKDTVITLPDYKPGEFYRRTARDSDGNLKTLYEFPFLHTPFMLGTYTLSDGECSIIKEFDAVGILELATSQRVIIIPKGAVTNLENVVTGFTPTNIQAIDLSHYNYHAERFIEAAARQWTRLEVMILGQQQQSLDTMKALGSLKHIDQLQLTQWTNRNSKEQPAVRLPGSLHITRLVLNNCAGYIANYFERAKGENRVSSLVFNKTQVTAEDIRYLAGMPDMQSVKFYDSGLTAKALEPLFESPTLVKLQINETNFDLQNLDLARVAHARRLNKIAFSSVAPLTVEQRQKITELRKIVPKVDVANLDGAPSF